MNTWALLFHDKDFLGSNHLFYDNYLWKTGAFDLLRKEMLWSFQTGWQNRLPLHWYEVIIRLVKRSAKDRQFWIFFKGDGVKCYFY